MIYFVGQLLLAMVIPGLHMKGLPVEELKGKKLEYLCNAYQCFYISLALIGMAHYFGVYDIVELATDFGKYLTITVVWGDITSLYWMLKGKKVTQSRWYDFFMGAILNPRIRNVDIKMVAEARWSWLTLLLITISQAVKQYRQYGEVSNELCFMIGAHWLYANACAKGEHFIVTTYDMVSERFGFMLNFWNICGVPFVYCFSSVYLGSRAPMNYKMTYLYGILYLMVYWIWDVANYQKNDLRLARQGEVEARKRRLFPVLPWSVIENPKVLSTPKGDLLVDGFYQYGRKIHYTMDISKAFLWGAVTHFTAFLPFFYLCFFAPFIFHRYLRDDRRCAAKYGEHWDEYRKKVPYVFIPFVY